MIGSEIVILESIEAELNVVFLLCYVIIPDVFSMTATALIQKAVYVVICALNVYEEIVFRKCSLDSISIFFLAN